MQPVSDIAATQLCAVSVSRQLSVSDKILLLLSKRPTAPPPSHLAPSPTHSSPIAVLRLVP